MASWRLVAEHPFEGTSISAPQSATASGLFVTLEGPEGSGKTTQLALLAEALRERGFSVITTREPGGLPSAEDIRAIVLHNALHARTEALLFLAARSEHVSEVIQPALAEGKVVLCDRFNDSTLAYQGHGLGLDVETLRALCRFASQGLNPALTLLLDLDPGVGLDRRLPHRRAGQLNLMIDLPEAERSPAPQEINKVDNRPLEFHERVRDGFLEEARRDADRIVTIDANRKVDVVHRDLLRAVTRVMKSRHLEARTHA